MLLKQFLKMPAFGLAFFLVLLLTACSSKEQALRLQGMQGTAVWHVTITHPPQGVSQNEIQAGVQAAFADSTQVIATWNKDSEVSRFNQYQGTDWFPVSAELVSLVQFTQQLSQASQGYYDVTVGPLIRLWGFSSQSSGNQVPNQEAVKAARALVGYEKLQLRTEPPALRKSVANLQLELASLADGFAADKAGEYLESLGIQHYMVEIAGEVRARGNSPRGDEWRIAIEKPLDGQQRAVEQILALQQAGLATSGDYRNFFVEGGQRYSHTLDPKTGSPIKHSLASVSVVAKQATHADAYATLLMALGEQKGLIFAQDNAIAAYFIWRTEQGFKTKASISFENSQTLIK